MDGKVKASDFDTKPPVPQMIAWRIAADGYDLAPSAVLVAVWREGMIQSVSLHLAAPGGDP